jgi:hypothetical protein
LALAMSTRAASVVFSARPQSVFAWQEPRPSFTGAGSTALTLARARVWRATYRARHSTDKKVSPSFHLPLQKGASSHAVVTSSSSSASPHEKFKKNSLAHRSRVPDPSNRPSPSLSSPSPPSRTLGVTRVAMVALRAIILLIFFFSRSFEWRRTTRRGRRRSDDGLRVCMCF